MSLMDQQMNGNTFYWNNKIFKYICNVTINIK